MRYAIVDGQRREAARGLSGSCPGCGATLRPRCGDVRVHHWAHINTLHCDHWWETETVWHRAWKDLFPVDCQEIRHRAPDGEWHIADVKTRYGFVLEFQHSHICPEERRSRELFYRRMVWVVNGLRLKRDLPAFADALAAGRIAGAKVLVCVVQIERNPLVKRWLDSQVPVFFDFGEHDWGVLSQIVKEPILWCYRGNRSDTHAYLIPVRLSLFIAHYTEENTPLKGIKLPIRPTVQARNPVPLRVPQKRVYRRRASFKQYMNRKAAQRRSTRF